MSDHASEKEKVAADGGAIRWTRRAVLGAVCAAVIGVYAWSAHSGVMELQASNAENTYYNLLVRGFRAGQLSVKREVPPGLPLSGGPSAPGANAPERRTQAPENLTAYDGVQDLSYYKGKLYLYFGVTPALALFWPYAALTGHYLPHKEAVVVFFSVGFLAGVVLLCAVWRRYFQEASFGAVAAGTLALGLANLAPALLGRCEVYEVAISCGYALAMLALAGVWAALQDARRRWRWLAAASLAYGLAVGARPVLLLGAVILLVPVAKAWREERRVWPLWLAATVPIGLVGLGLMVYNALRFDNPLEFGQRYQLPLIAHQQFSPRYLWFNFQAGFLDPARWSLRYPFVRDISPPAWPRGYSNVDVPFGILTNIPLVWLALAAPLAWRGRSGEARLILRWFLGAVALLFGAGALVLCLHDSMALRYELEYASPLVLLAVIGILALERALAGRPAWRRAARWGWGLLLAFSTAFNLFAGIELQADSRFRLGNDFLHKQNLGEAIVCYQEAMRINPLSADACANLGLAYFKKGEIQEAMGAWQQALEIKPDQLHVLNNLAWLLATTPDASLRDGARAVALAAQADQLSGGGNPMILHTLAAARAETGDYALAATTAQRGLELAVAQKNDALAATLQKEVQLYETRKPVREAPP
ncbi:MAG: tetratricopeptide repeat protein [Verrucomicrobiota bacterium]|jgi:tetratricopeptide (TPR) repeat protein